MQRIFAQVGAQPGQRQITRDARRGQDQQEFCAAVAEHGCAGGEDFEGQEWIGSSAGMKTVTRP